MKICNKYIPNRLTVRVTPKRLVQSALLSSIKICNKDLDDRTAGPFYPTKICK